MKYLIAGNGPAAVNAVKAIRKRDKTGSIVMVSPENNEPYSRITVPELMVSEIEAPNIYFANGFYEEFAVETRLGKKLTSIDPQAQTAALSDGEELCYDRLLIATGSRPVIPDWADMSLKGMYSLWDKADAERISKEIKAGENVVIAGAGLVAFQAARALNAFGMKVTLVARRFIMSRQLDSRAAELLKAAAEKCGVRVLLHTSVTELKKSGDTVTGVTLSNGETIETSCVFACIGTVPNTDMLASDYVAVDDRMKTALPNVYAAGDIVKARMQGSGEVAIRAIWPNAVTQGAIAGLNMSGANVDYEGSRALNSIELFGMSFISAGAIEAAEGQEELVIKNTEKAYHKVILEGEKLCGMCFAGDVQEAGVLISKLGERPSGYMGGIPSFDAELISE